jgi:hypothetical protein
MNELTKKVDQFEYEFTNKQISPWGGSRLISVLFSKLRLKNLDLFCIDFLSLI